MVRPYCCPQEKGKKLWHSSKSLSDPHWSMTLWHRKEPFTLLGGRKTLKRIVLQQLFAKAKGTNKHAKWTGRKQLQKNCGKLRKIAQKMRRIAKLGKIVKSCRTPPL